MLRILFATILLTLHCSHSFACDEYFLTEKQKEYFKEYLQSQYVAPVGEVAFVGEIPVGKKVSVELRMKKNEELPEIDYDMLVLPNKKERKEKIHSGNNPRCSITADFNGDGQMDFAGLYKYIGEQKRGNNWILDLVILYSTQDGSIKHMVYPYTGQYFEDSKKSVLVYLRQRGRQGRPGKVNLMPGQHFLDYPGIGVFRRGRPVATYYWDKKTRKFSELAMGVDD